MSICYYFRVGARRADAIDRDISRDRAPHPALPLCRLHPGRAPLDRFVRLARRSRSFRDHVQEQGEHGDSPLHGKHLKWKVQSHEKLIGVIKRRLEGE